MGGRKVYISNKFTIIRNLIRNLIYILITKNSFFEKTIVGPKISNEFLEINMNNYLKNLSFK